MDSHDFIARYAGIYEHSPWVAEHVAMFAADLDDTQRLADLMADCVDNADVERQLTLIRAHPDLANKMQVEGELTAESTEEQASAGLDQCSKVEYERFQALNDAYKKKFGFPFVMAVRGSNCAEILEAFGARLKNDYDVEFETALAEIHKIARLRLDALEQNR
ncbi:MAG: 2-oxo-4-hydroxy-4-carboxy-5-ureidoimidazoline decarboxylase [Gammaproteobacteria bacterium]|nr:2-oxo-4-hydroxy-4-carboxy-5-ureidoimidazoline decarboxylase [Gammaproteobacteria bacterium]